MEFALAQSGRGLGPRSGRGRPLHCRSPLSTTGLPFVPFVPLGSFVIKTDGGAKRSRHPVALLPPLSIGAGFVTIFLTCGRFFVPVVFMNMVTPIDPLAETSGSDPAPDRMEACDLFSDEGMAAQAARHVRMLQELAEIAMTAARAVGRQVAAEPVADSGPAAEPAEIAKPGLVLTRIARCVRQTVALEAKLTADYRAWVAKSSEERAAALAKQAERAAAAEARKRERKKIKVERAAKTVLECSTPQDQHDFCHGM